MLTIALAGNPNCGKTALFNKLTGVRQRTGNWPGVTVDRKEGRFTLERKDVAVIDLPGIYSLDASSLDEQVTRDYLLSRDARLIVNVIDASNLERNLYLTVQLLEMGVPLVVAMNMMDVARKRGITLDLVQLGERLGCPVVPVVAVTGEGLAELKLRILDVASGACAGGVEMIHEDTVEQAIAELRPALRRLTDKANDHWLALKLLEGDPRALALAGDALLPQVEHWQRVIEDRTGEDVDIHIADTRYGHAHALAVRSIRAKGKLGRTLSDRIDKLVLNRMLGIPIFLAVMYLMFMFTINIGGAFVDFFDGWRAPWWWMGWGTGCGAWAARSGWWCCWPTGWAGAFRWSPPFIPIITGLYLIPLYPGRQRLHGPGGIRDGPLHEHHRPARQGLRTHDRRVWL